MKETASTLSRGESMSTPDGLEGCRQPFEEAHRNPCNSPIAGATEDMDRRFPGFALSGSARAYVSHREAARAPWPIDVAGTSCALEAGGPGSGPPVCA